MRLPNLIVGISPFAAASYALFLDSPKTFPARGTVVVRPFRISDMDLLMGVPLLPVYKRSLTALSSVKERRKTCRRSMGGADMPGDKRKPRRPEGEGPGEVLEGGDRATSAVGWAISAGPTSTKRIGRPPKAEGKRKAANLTFRLRRNLRERLQHAAQENDRSISEETERRLEASFRDKDLIQALGGRGAESVIRPILFFLGALEHRGISWPADPILGDAITAGIGLISEAVLNGPLSGEAQTVFLRKQRGRETEVVATTAIWVLQTLGLAEK